MRRDSGVKILDPGATAFQGCLAIRRLGCGDTLRNRNDAPRAPLARPGFSMPLQECPELEVCDCMITRFFVRI